jgi:hypothetical protein
MGVGMSILGRLVAVLAALLLVAVPAGAQEVPEIEDYADYQPQTWCSPAAKPGTVAFAAYIVKQHGGGFGGISRRCRIGGVSEHKEGRAFDWTLDATRRADRRRANAFLAEIFATDKVGNEHALARRMGVMYVIWNDHMYSSYRGFEARDYLASSCPSLRKCSASMRHRNHMHISLSRPGGKGRTSWYVDRLGAQ